MEYSNNMCKMCGSNMIESTSSSENYCGICEEGFKVLEFLKNNNVDISESGITDYINSIIDESSLKDLYSILDEPHFQSEYAQDKLELIQDRLDILRSIFDLEKDT